MSRYYAPVTHRFVNADGYFQAGGSILDANMCAYCRNNPISFIDPSGKFAITLTTALTYIAGAVIASILTVELTKTITAIATSPSVQQSISDAINSVSSAFSNSTDNSYSISKDIAVPTEPPGKVQAIYPVDPMEFNPKGLQRVIRVPLGEGKNGGIIHWVIPSTQITEEIVIFEWDEDYRIGPHYHAMLPEDKGKHNNDHNYPGTPVPEPWNTLYFNYN